MKMLPFDLDVLSEVIQLRETIPVDLLPYEKGTPIIAAESRSESNEKDKKHRKHKHQHKVRSKNKDKDKKDTSENNDKVKKKIEECTLRLRAIVMYASCGGFLVAIFFFIA